MALVGTDKRERQKANRQLKLEEMARDARKRTTRRRGLQIGLGIPARDRGSSSRWCGCSVTTTTRRHRLPTRSLSVSSDVPTEPLPCPLTDGSSEKVETFPAAPGDCIDPTKTYTIQVDTTAGSYTAELYATKAPATVNSFVYLARYHYFDDTPCHRVVPDFVVQCGDPTGTGTGGPGYTIPDELPAAGEYQLGSLAMANSSQPNTGGSQFFVISGDQGVALPPSYTLFGQVTEGLDTIAAINALGVGDGPPSTPRHDQLGDGHRVLTTVGITSRRTAQPLSSPWTSAAPIVSHAEPERTQGCSGRQHCNGEALGQSERAVQPLRRPGLCFRNDRKTLDQTEPQ